MGIDLARKLYSWPMQEVALHLIPECRRRFVIGEGMLSGIRFNDDLNIFERLESMTDEKTFAAFPLVAIDEALTDAAKADHWYAHEKNYGMEDSRADAELECEVVDNDD